MDHEELVAEVADIRGDLDEHKKVCAIEARVRAQQDRDLADTQERVKAIHNSVQALGITQSEHTRTLGQHTKILGEHTLILNEHTLKLDLLELGMMRVETRLNRLELGQGRLETGLSHLETGLSQLETGLGRMEIGQKTILNLLERLTPQA